LLSFFLAYFADFANLFRTFAFLENRRSFLWKQKGAFLGNKISIPGNCFLKIYEEKE